MARGEKWAYGRTDAVAKNNIDYEYQMGKTTPTSKYHGFEVAEYMNGRRLGVRAGNVGLDVVKACTTFF